MGFPKTLQNLNIYYLAPTCYGHKPKLDSFFFLSVPYDTSWTKKKKKIQGFEPLLLTE